MSTSLKRERRGQTTSSTRQEISRITSIGEKKGDSSIWALGGKKERNKTITNASFEEEGDGHTERGRGKRMGCSVRSTRGKRKSSLFSSTMDKEKRPPPHHSKKGVYRALQASPSSMPTRREKKGGRAAQVGP